MSCVFPGVCDVLANPFLAVSILGATISPYLFNFYSSGGVEDEWNEEDLVPNKITATFGMSFGGSISIAVLIGAAVGVHYRRNFVFHQQRQNIGGALGRRSNAG